MEQSNGNSIKSWLPKAIFFLGTLTLIIGVGFGIWLGLYGGMNEFAWPIIIGDIALAVLMWGVSFIVEAAILYIEKNK